MQHHRGTSPVKGLPVLDWDQAATIQWPSAAGWSGYLGGSQAADQIDAS